MADTDPDRRFEIQRLRWEIAVLNMEFFGLLWMKQTLYPARALIGPRMSRDDGDDAR